MYLLVIFYINFAITSATELELINPPILSGTYLHSNKSNLFKNATSWSRLHSNQLNNSFLSKYFKIVNKTNILVSNEANRESLCSSIKHCDESMPADQCVLNINLLMYLNENDTNKTRFNQIKLVKLNLVLSDFLNDSLEFEQTNYEFNFSLNKFQADKLEFGTVKAVSFKNPELNNLVKYYLDFEDKDKKDLIDLIEIDETTGSLVLNQTKLSLKSFKLKYEFYVVAMLQCSTQKPLQNRTLIKLNLEKNEQNTKPTIHLVNLIESKQLNKIECLKLTHKDLNTNSIALAQIQIENFGEQEELKFSIESSNSNLSLRIENLIDNIYILYLSKSEPQEITKFLSDIYKISLQILSPNGIQVKTELYLCASVQTEQELYEEFSLVQFKNNFYVLNSTEQILTLTAHNLALKNSRLNFVLDENNQSLNAFQVNSSANSLSLRLEQTKQETNNLELLQHVLYIHAHESSVSSLKFDKIYGYLKQLSLAHEKFLHFTAKVLVNTLKETRLQEELTANQQVLKFNLNPENLIENSIIGYLPHVFQLVNWNNSLNFKNSIENFYYSLETTTLEKCFNLSKFDGILSISNLTCLTNSNYPIKLKVNLLNSQNTEYSILNFYQIELYPNKLETNLLNLQILQNSSLNLNFEINFFSKANETLPTFLKLANLISKENFKFYLNSNLFLIDSKSNSLYLNLTNFYEQNANYLLNKCINLPIVAKKYEYLNSIKRKLVLKQEFNLNLCFLVNLEQSEFIRAVLDSNFSFEFLVKSQNLNLSILWSIFFSLFLICCVFLLLTIFYLWHVRRQRKNNFI